MIKWFLKLVHDIKLGRSIGQHMTVRAAAALLGVSSTHLYTLIRAGDLQAVRLGKRAIRLSASEVQRLVQRGRAFAAKEVHDERQGTEPRV